MIVVKIMGGLGNQMFQYAFGKALAIKFNTELFVDINHFDSEADERITIRRDFGLNCFELKAKKWLQLNNKLFFPSNSFFSRVINKLERLLKIKSILYERHHGYDGTILRMATKNSYLIGLWQGEDYFKHIREVLLEDFKFKFNEEHLNKIALKKINETNTSVSIHIRRGDYVSNPKAGEIHGVCSLDYYKKAVEIIINKYVNATFFIFSDDLEWCKSELCFIDNKTYVHGHDGSHSYLDMYLMSQCQHNIIANSTFSWWGAWLNNNPQKIVISPKQWFLDPHSNKQIASIIPSSWIRI